jgi:hypothetical protein
MLNTVVYPPQPGQEMFGIWLKPSQKTLPTIAFFRAGPLLRRNGPVPGILAAHRPGAIMDKSGRRFVGGLKATPARSKNRYKFR